MYLVGKIEFCGPEELYYTQDYKKFYFDEKGEKPLTEEDLKRWAVVINSEWSISNIIYETTMNLNYEKEGKDRTWKTTYSVVGYDGICSEIIAYGKDEIESLGNCKKLFKYLQEEYNKDNAHF